MLIIGLIAAALLYGFLYWSYAQAEAQLSGAASTLAVINQMLFVSEPSIFMLLRGLILVTLFYVVADTLLSPAKRSLKNRRQRKREAEEEKKTFRGVKPIPPQQDDDFAPHY